MFDHLGSIENPEFPTQPSAYAITVNKHTAVLDGNRLKLVVADRDPGLGGNWIDTTGHTSGTALLRWVGTDHHPLPTCKVIQV